MKKSLRLPFSLLLVIAAFTLLTCRTAVRRGLGSGSPFSSPDDSAPALDPLLNATLLRLAAADPADAALRREVDDLLDGNFPSLPSSRARPLPRTISLYRRENHPDSSLHRRGSAARYSIRLRSPNDYRVLPEFRRSLRDWFRSRHFHPYILSDLLHQVKRPISGSASPYPSCAVVGNSGILLKSDHGALIDGHDLVIRLNNARTDGYHKNVGSKTGLSFVNSNILHLCARRERCFCHPYGETVPIIMYVCQAVHFLDYTVCNSSHKAPLLVTDIRFDLLCSRIVKYYSLKRFVEETGKPPEEWARVHDEKMFHYSSGMQAVMLALGICDKVSVFGFGKSTEAKHHYHTNQKAELDLHDYVAEYALYRDLAERPQVIPFLKDSGFKVPSVVFYH